MSFSVVFWAFIMPVISLLVFLAAKGLHKVGDYLNGNKEATDKRPIKPWVFITLISGFILGGLLDGTIPHLQPCVLNFENAADLVKCFASGA